jgi:hypothetical protein
MSEQSLLPLRRVYSESITRIILMWVSGFKKRDKFAPELRTLTRIRGGVEVQLWLS